MATTQDPRTTEALNDPVSDAFVTWLFRLHGATMGAAGGSGEIRWASSTRDIVGPEGYTYRKYEEFTVVPPEQTGFRFPVTRMLVPCIDHTLIHKILEVAGLQDRPKADLHQVQWGVTQAKTGTKSTWHVAMRSMTDVDITNASWDLLQLTMDLTTRQKFDTRLSKKTFNPGDFPRLSND